MAQQTIVKNSGQPLGLPNTGLGTDQGDTWDQAVDKINANTTELYAGNTSVPMANTAITTVGAGVLTGSGIAGGLITRTGSVAAYSDATDTAAAIVAARTGAVAGESWLLYIKNGVNFAETITAGTGITLTGAVVIPPMSAGIYLVTLTSLTAVGIRHLVTTPIAGLPPAQYSTAALQSTVIPAANMAGADFVAFENTGTTPANLQSDTAANIVAAMPGATLGTSYVLEIRNSSGSANTATITTNTGISLHGTMTIAQNTTRKFMVVLTSLTAVDIYSMGVTAAAA